MNTPVVVLGGYLLDDCLCRLGITCGQAGMGKIYSDLVRHRLAGVRFGSQFLV